MKNLLQPATRERYGRAEDLFTAWQRESCPEWFELDEELQDYACADFVLDSREDNIPLQVVVDALSALQKSTGGRRRFRAAFAVVEGIRKEQPVRHAPPIPLDAAMAASAQLASQGYIAEGFAVLIGFVALLRINEVLRLMVSDLIFPEVHGQPGVLIILLRVTKCGAPDSEKVLINNPQVISLLRVFVSRRAASERLLATSYHRVNVMLQASMNSLGFDKVRFTTHSLRRGGATALAMAGWPLSSIMDAGRWASERSAKLYIMKGEVLVVRMRQALTPNQQARISRLATCGFDIVLAALEH